MRGGNRHNGMKFWAVVVASAFVAAACATAGGVEFSRRTTNGPLAGTDALGRRMPSVGEGAPARRTDKVRQVGLFYFLWCGEHGRNPPRDVSKILAENPNAGNEPDNPVWGPHGFYHHWGEPFYGYYYSDDEWVVRHHIKLFIQADIDFLFFDTTNAAIYERNAKQVMRVLQEYHDEGWKIPRVMFYTHTASGKTVQRIYDAVYRKAFAPDTWFRLDGKPVIVAIEEQCSPETRDFFTIVKSQWPNEKDKPGGWPWMDFTRPQRLFPGEKVAKSVMNVSVAQHPTCRFGDSAMYGEKGNRGRAFHDGANNPAPGAWVRGGNFAEQFEHAIKTDPDIVLVTGWNEWIMGRWKGRPGRPILFVDCANGEYSRDLEMMRGGYFDNYFLQLVAFVRRYKGTDPYTVNPKRQDLVYDGFADGDFAREAKGYGTTYTNRTQRNVPLTIAVRHDETNVTFTVKTKKAITGSAAEGTWLSFFLEIPAEKPTYTTIGPADGESRISGDTYTLTVRREKIGLPASGPFELRFKFADSSLPYRTVSDFYDLGCSLPLGRLRFVYRGE